MNAAPQTAFLLILLAVILSGCTTAEGEGDERPAEPTIDTAGFKPGCFYAREVNNWEALNREYLLVYAPNKSRAYLMRFAPPSPEVRNAVTIGFGGRSRICGKTGERLVVGRGGGPGREYTINNVWRLDSDAVDTLTDSPEDKAVQPAAESPGAEVEADLSGQQP